MIRPHFESQLDYQQQQHLQQQQLQQQQAAQQQQQISKIVSSPPPTIVGSPNGTTMCVAKLLVGLDHAPMAFNVRHRIIGDGGTNLNYIRQETGAIVSLRGRGSLAIEPQTGQEAPEPLQLCIEHPSLDGLQSAKQLAKNLIETLQEELNLFQENIVPKQNFQIIQQPTLVQTTQVPQMPSMIRAQHVTQPNGIIHQPPPPVLPPQGFVQHAQSQPPPPQIIQQPPTIIQSHVPMQIHQQPSNVVISQIQTAPQITNISNPPPGTQIRPPMMQVKNAAPPHLSQPPPNIQLSQPTEAPQQILVNQAPPSYQVQYIQQNPTIQTSSAPHQPGQVTIQHVIQPQPQPIQGIMQTTMPPPQFDQFQRPPQTQQIIAVQGSTAFMVPPPNIIHQTVAPQPQSQIIVQSQPIITHPPPNSIPQELVQTTMQPTMAQSALGPPPMTQVPMLVNSAEDKKPGELQIKQDLVKLEEGPPPGTIIQQITQKPTVIPVSSIAGIPLSQPPPPIMSMPPPTVQHIVGNTIITSQANPPISHAIPQQIYSQIPVSIQSFQPAHQQIHMNGSTHFVLNAPQPWPPSGPTNPPPQIQQVPVSSMQNIQFTAQPMRNPNEFQIISQPTIISAAEYRPPPQQQHIITTSSFNPQMQPPPGVQVFHTVPPPQQIITSIPNPQPQPQIIEAAPHPVPPPHPGATHQIITTPVPPPPPPFTTTVQYAAPHEPKQTTIDVQLHQMHAMRVGQKRKHPDEESLKNIPPKMGMGMIPHSSTGGVTAKNTMSSTSTATVTTSSTSGGLITSQIYSAASADDLQQLEVGTKSGNEQQSGGELNAENFGGAGVGSNINNNNSIHSGPKHGQNGPLQQQQHMGGNSRGRGAYRMNQPYYANNNIGRNNNSNGNYQFNSFQRGYEPSAPSAPPPPTKCRW